MSLCLHMKRRFLLLLLLDFYPGLPVILGYCPLYLHNKWFNQQQFSIIDQIYVPKTVDLPATTMLQNMLLQVRLELTTPACL